MYQLMRRKRSWFRRVIEWFTREEPPKTPPPPIPEEPSEVTRDGGASGQDFPTPPQDIPPGWKFEGLYYGDRAPADRRVINKHPDDYEIATADDVIVSYTDGLGTIYRTIHGANSRKDVGKLITRTTVVVSPPR